MRQIFILRRKNKMNALNAYCIPFASSSPATYPISRVYFARPAAGADLAWE